MKVASISSLIDKKKHINFDSLFVLNTLLNLLNNTDWGELDYLLINLPPGTTNIVLTLLQKFPEAQSIIVTTPQEIAYKDAIKTGLMLQSSNMYVLGIIENMSYFIPEKHPDEKYRIFGIGAGDKLATELQVPLLAQIPLIAGVCNLNAKSNSEFNTEHYILHRLFANMAQKFNQWKKIK